MTAATRVPYTVRRLPPDMDGFYRRQNIWHVDGAALTAIAEDRPTPCYVYSQSLLQNAYRQLETAFCHSRPQICYAVKANDNLSLLRLLAQAGAGFDIVSGGELARVLTAGGNAAHIIFSGVGKSVGEIQAALRAGIGCFNVESAQELTRIEHCAATLNKVAQVACRLTLNIDGDTHRHLTTGVVGGKFGVSGDEGQHLAQVAADSPHLAFLGFSAHIGSQIADEEKYLRLATAMAEQVAAAENNGLTVRRVDMGGGFAVADDKIAPAAPALSRYDAKLAELFADKEIFIEPGRCLVAAAGACLTRVEYVKQSGDKTIWITDAGMNDLLRPALYDARHPVETVVGSDAPMSRGDVVGPVCESADVMARNCRLNAAPGDLLLIFNAGAYGMVMASNYNARPRPAAYLVHQGTVRQIRRADTIADMMDADNITETDNTTNPEI